jgi:Nicotinate phosphoribosyltransferase (NAPRTase) N-terminal domain
MSTKTSPLLTGLYQLAMMQAYLDHGQTQTAVFEFFVRTLPPRRNRIAHRSGRGQTNERRPAPLAGNGERRGPRRRTVAPAR